MKLIIKIIFPALVLYLSTANAEMKFEKTNGWFEWEFSTTNEMRALVEQEIRVLEEGNPEQIEQKTLKCIAYKGLLDAIDSEWKSIVTKQNQLRVMYYNERQSGLGFGVQSVEFVGDLLDRQKIFPPLKYENLSDGELAILLKESNDKIIQTRREIREELLQNKNDEHVHAITDLANKRDALWQKVRSWTPYDGKTIVQFTKSDGTYEDTILRLDEADQAKRNAVHLSDEQRTIVKELETCRHEIGKLLSELILPNISQYQGRLEILQREHKKRAELMHIQFMRHVELSRVKHKLANGVSPPNSLF